MTTTPTTPYRSRAWFDTPELYGWLRRAAFKAEGFGEPAYEGRPIIGICNTWSQVPCPLGRGLSLAFRQPTAGAVERRNPQPQAY